MSQKFITSQILLVLVLSVQGKEVVHGPPDFCTKTSFHRNDQFHKDAPSAEMGNFHECSSWQNFSCCTQALTEAIGRDMFMGLYNWSYNLCGNFSTPCANLSTPCAEYIRNEECFYWCEPMLGYFRADPNIQRVPVCANYCDSWFEACKDDFTCYNNWEEAYMYNNASGMPNRCPEDSQCRKFSEVFADGKELCNRMWGTSYSYSTDTDNCTVMAFDNSMTNPNYRLTFPRSGSLSTVVLGPNVLMHVSAMLVYLLLTVAIINASY